MLTIDIGNTRVKWALWERGRITRSGSTHLSKQEPATAFETWNTLPRQDHVIAACVAGERVERALDEWTRSHWSVQTEFLRSTAQLNGVRNAYPDPAQYGVDRWAALLGAHALYDVPVCIIDTGTAITVDLLDAEGIHRGGRILPGLQMMREALVRCTDGI
ncbi:MAG: type III pantothenate kinase, partial [Thiotrichales bacterium]